MKINYIRVIAFFLLIAFSVGFGFAYDGIATAIEKHNYPMEERYRESIADCAEEFGVPEHILWAVVSTESEFVSNLVSDGGEIGLMQISPERLDHICQDILKEPTPDTGMLYDPETNLRCGTALLSELFQRYGVWETVYAAYFIGEDQVDAWLATPELVNEIGRLQNLPDRATADYVDQMIGAASLYGKLYFGIESP